MNKKTKDNSIEGYNIKIYVAVRERERERESFPFITTYAPRVHHYLHKSKPKPKLNTKNVVVA